jgi:multicomponent Na+:H+ antiporter subunit E
LKKLTLAILSFILWFLFVWPFDPISGELRIQTTVVGIVVAVLVGYYIGDKLPGRTGVGTVFRRIFWMILYVPYFSYYVIIANLDVVYRVIHPEMPIRPGIVKVRTELKSDAGRTMLANSITLTPGTLSVDLADDGYLYIHWINVKADDIEGATKHIVYRFEKMIRRMFE